MKPQRRTPQRQTRVVGLTAGLLGGGAAGLLLLAPTLSSAAGSDAAEPSAAFAQQTPTTVTATSEETTVATEVAPVDDEQTDEGGRGNRLTELLQPLVDAGTITQEQLDAVIAELEGAWPSGGHGGGPGMPGGPGRPDGPGGIVLGGLDALVDVIGIDAADLRDQLRDGATLAEIATANGVDPQAVIDALVAEATERVTTAVADGRITQEEADERLAEITERITAWVHGESDELDADDANSDATDDSTASPTSQG